MNDRSVEAAAIASLEKKGVAHNLSQACGSAVILTKPNGEDYQFYRCNFMKTVNERICSASSLFCLLLLAPLTPDLGITCLA